MCANGAELPLTLSFSGQEIMTARLRLHLGVVAVNNLGHFILQRSYIFAKIIHLTI